MVNDLQMLHMIPLEETILTKPKEETNGWCANNDLVAFAMLNNMSECIAK